MKNNEKRKQCILDYQHMVYYVSPLQYYLLGLHYTVTLTLTIDERQRSILQQVSPNIRDPTMRPRTLIELSWGYLLSCAAHAKTKGVHSLGINQWTPFALARATQTSVNTAKVLWRMYSHYWRNLLFSYSNQKLHPNILSNPRKIIQLFTSILKEGEKRRSFISFNRLSLLNIHPPAFDL